MDAMDPTDPASGQDSAQQPQGYPYKLPPPPGYGGAPEQSLSSGPASHHRNAGIAFAVANLVPLAVIVGVFAMAQLCGDRAGERCQSAGWMMLLVSVAAIPTLVVTNLLAAAFVFLSKR